MKLTPEQVAAMLDALKNQDPDAALVMLEELLAASASEEAPAEEAPTEALSTDPAPEAPAEGETAPEAASAAAEESAEAVQSTDAEKLTRLSAVLFDLTGDEDPEAALVKLTARRDAEQARRREADAALRRGFVAELITLGAETPATAWADDDRRVPVQRLSAEPLADLRARVAVLKGARKPSPAAPERMQGASPGEAGRVEKLSAAALRRAKEMGITPEEMAERVARAVR